MGSAVLDPCPRLVKRNLILGSSAPTHEPITSVGAGQIVGEIALLDGGPRTASVVCNTDVEAVVINQRNFQDVLDNVPAIASVLLATLATRARVRNMTREAN
jgi:CRP-like cAMP-binding protein